MKKKFSLQTMELAEAAAKDAPNFGLIASIEEKDDEISVAYDCAAPCVQKEVVAICWDDVHSIVRSAYSECEYQMKWLREDVQYLRERLNKHVGAGHFPAVNDAGQMKKALKALGLEESFEVKVPEIYVQY